MHRRTNIIIFLIAIILAGVAIYFIMGYINEIESAYTSISTKPVVVAVQNIPENIAITDEMLKVVEVPADMVLPQAYDSIEDIVGSIAKTDIVKDEHILSNHIYKEGKGQDKFSYSVPENMRAVSIAINDVSGVSGLIKANDRVDILLTYAYPGDAKEEAEPEETEAQGELPAMAESTEQTLIDREYLREISEEILKDRRIVSIDANEITITMMQNVQVLAVYGSSSQTGEDGERKDSGTITLALEPEDVELLTNAEAMGSLKLSLRSPVDEAVVDLKPIISLR
ncbi:MAG: Flp pilus assembly protein CpaB [Caldicoprobacterales bacterium]|jgi:pilus assembly protein CpaB|nr:Flp pilus assembly protein CpaB [Clostridiales bacterium]